MTRSHLPQFASMFVRRGALSWARRAILLGSIAASLALAGDQAVAGARVPVDSHPQSLAAINGSGLAPALATGFETSVRRSVDSMSDGSIEVVSLLILGLCLIGAGQALTRAGRTNRGSGGTDPIRARPAGLAGVATRARARDIGSHDRHAAR